MKSWKSLKKSNMTDLWWKFLEMNLVLALLWLVFKLVQPRLGFGLQRISLLSLPLLSLLVVVFKSTESPANDWKLRFNIVELPSVELKPAQTISETQNWLTLESLYWLGVVLAGLFFLFRLLQVLVLFSRAESMREGKLHIAQLPRKDSFSFFNRIQIEQGLDEASRKIVLQHERIHSEKRHSLDILYFESLQCFLWFNPFVYLLKKDAVHVHEFEVDQLMYSRHRKDYLEFLLSYALGTSSSSYLLTHRFLRKLTLVKRIKIMKHNTKKRGVLALALPFLALSLALVSWTARPEPQREQGRKTAAVIDQEEKMAEFKGGMDALVKYLTNNVRYPEAAVKNKITGKVFVSFVVTENGKIEKVKVLKGIHESLDAEAKRVVESMPDWNPAEKGGKKVSSEMQLPISFAL